MMSVLRAVAALALAAACVHPARALHAWGDDNKGQLGDGTAGDARAAAAPVTGLPSGVPAVHAAAGFWHSLAAGSDGRVYAWGFNAYGQLGDGGTVDHPSPAPTAPIPDGVSVTAVAAGMNHSMALGADGGVYTWGDNQVGQLGNGYFVNTRPARVTLPEGVAAAGVAAGALHSLAVDTAGRVHAWGGNESGQVGDGTTAQRVVPVTVSGLHGRNIVAVAAGGRHSLALDDTGKVHAWGGNGYGQLGDGSYANRATPAPVAGLPAGVAIRAISAGQYHSLALGSDGKVYAWGGNDSGELGDGAAGIFAYRTEPMPVIGFPAGVSIAAIAAGDYFSLAADATGQVWAWGYNYNGQLGDGTTTNRKHPVLVTGLPSGIAIRALAAGGFHALAVPAAPPPALSPARALRLAAGLEAAEPQDLESAALTSGHPLHVADIVRLLRAP